MFFAMFGQFSQRFVLPNLRMAAAFAWERYCRACMTCAGQLPMAIHGYRRHDLNSSWTRSCPRHCQLESLHRLTRAWHAIHFGCICQLSAKTMQIWWRNSHAWRLNLHISMIEWTLCQISTKTMQIRWRNSHAWMLIAISMIELMPFRLSLGVT